MPRLAAREQERATALRFGAPGVGGDREVWAMTPRLFAVGAKGQLGANVAVAVSEGLRALSPGLLG